jgi:hypothetical protein
MHARSPDVWLARPVDRADNKQTTAFPSLTFSVGAERRGRREVEDATDSRRLPLRGMYDLWAEHTKVAQEAHHVEHLFQIVAAQSRSAALPDFFASPYYAGLLASFDKRIGECVSACETRGHVAVAVCCARCPRSCPCLALHV